MLRSLVLLGRENCSRGIVKQDEEGRKEKLNELEKKEYLKVGPWCTDLSELWLCGVAASSGVATPVSLIPESAPPDLLFLDSSLRMHLS